MCEFYGDYLLVKFECTDFIQVRGANKNTGLVCIFLLAFYVRNFTVRIQKSMKPQGYNKWWLVKKCGAVKGG